MYKIKAILGNTVIDLLKDFNLRSTQCRAEVLSIFFGKDVALSHSNLERKLNNRFDRVTLYRTLRTFVEKGILHKVLDDSGIRYALCKDCTFDHHDHQHIHFKCLKCGNTQCIDDVSIPEIKLPQGFSTVETNLLVQGICKDCN